MKPIGSTKSVLLTSRSSAAAATVSVAVLLLLPPSPPDGSSGVVVEIDAVLPNTRAALPGWKFGRSTSVIDCTSSLAIATVLVQLNTLLAGVSCAPAAMVQLEPALLEAIEITVPPLSPGGNEIVSVTVTAAAGDGPLLRYEST